MIPEIVIDAEIKFSDITWTFYNILCQMEPFGPENDRPTFLAKNVTDTGESRILKEQHLRVCLRQGNHVYTGIGFGMAEKFQLLADRQPVDVVFKLDVNEWRDTKSLQLRLIDIKKSSSTEA
ncbi:MAG: hypothetical protein NVV59_06590 [Chitinophagaceae bacterium]|nr:hypothetical protein [Chitinophagaceae bacterium]